MNGALNLVVVTQENVLKSKTDLLRDKKKQKTSKNHITNQIK